MTTAAAATAATDAPDTPPPSRHVLRQMAQAIRRFPAFISRERHWLVLLIPALLSWIAPFRTQDYVIDGLLRWCWDRWWNPNSLISFQPLAPLAFALLLWSRREELRAQWHRVLRKYAPSDSRRRGNAIPYLLGCLTLLFGYCIQVKGIAVGAQVLIIVGAIYWLYGPLMLRAMLVPLSFLLLLVPPPDSIVEKIGIAALRFMVAAAAAILRVLHFPVVVGGVPTNQFMRTGNGSVLELNLYTVDGSGSLACAAFLLLVYGVYFRLRASVTTLLIALGLIFAALLNLLRIMAAVVVYSASPSWGLRIRDLTPHVDSAPWLEKLNFSGLVAVAAVFLAIGGLRLLARSGSWFSSPVKSALVRTSRGIDRVTNPIDQGLAQSGKGLLSLWTRSERALEHLLKTLFPRRRRSSSRHHSGGRRRSGRR